MNKNSSTVARRCWVLALGDHRRSRHWLGVVAWLFTACGSGTSELSCGDGTIEQGGQCVAAPSAGLGSGGKPSGEDGDGEGGSSGMLGDDDVALPEASPEVSPYPECAYDGLKGSTMALRTQPSGRKYCIDTTEVSQSQYAEYLPDAEAVGVQDELCEGMDFGKPTAPGCFTPGQTPNAPVTCVSWCQAKTYCAWAGKRLCGYLNGPNAREGGADLQDPDQSEWFNACSNSGKWTFSYGNRFDAAACPALNNELSYEVGRASCADAEGDIFDLSGGVSEWVDYWHDSAGYPDFVSEGGTNRTGEYGACAGFDGGTQFGGYPEIGFRCCASSL